MLPTGGSRIELLEPLHAESPVGKFISKRGEGIHHIAVCVENIESALERFKAAGATVVREPYNFEEAPEAWIATFSDPDDNYFQLVSPMPDMPAA